MGIRDESRDRRSRQDLRSDGRHRSDDHLPRADWIDTPAEGVGASRRGEPEQMSDASEWAHPYSRGGFDSDRRHPARGDGYRDDFARRDDGRYGNRFERRGRGGLQYSVPDRPQTQHWQPATVQEIGRDRRGPKGYQRSDERICEEICERLTLRHDLDVSEVSVDVKNGNVALEGSVSNRFAKHAIEDVADGCFGVKDVDNRIRVIRPGQREASPLSVGNPGAASDFATESSADAGTASTGAVGRGS